MENIEISFEYIKENCKNIKDVRDLYESHGISYQIALKSLFERWEGKV